MRTKNLFIMATFAIALAGCNNSEIVNGNSQFSDIVLNATAGVESEAPQSRVLGTSWEADDVIGIFQLQGATVLNANSKYVSSGTSSFTPAGASETIYFPVEISPKSDFIAYYPYMAGQTGFDYAVDVTSQSNQEAIDLLTADKVVGKDKTAPAVAFNFKHRLSKLSLTLTAGNGLTAGDLAGITVKITGQKPTATFNINTAVLTPSGAVQTITLNTVADGTTADAIILPAAESAGRQLTFTLSIGDTFVWNIPDAKVFNAGEKNIYNITLNRTSIEVTSSITDWAAGNGSGESGSAE